MHAVFGLRVRFGPTPKADTISVRGAGSDLSLATMEWAHVGVMYRLQVAARLTVSRLLRPVRECLCRLAARARRGAGCRVVGDDEVVQVQFVGSGDAFGSGGRWQTCIRLAASGKTLLVDCGATSLVALKTQRIDPNTIDAVVVTHLHGDHFGGLPFLILDGQFSRRTAPLVVAGPPGTDARLAAAMEVLFPGSSRVQRQFPVEVVELARDGTPADISGATVRGWEVEHASGAPPLAVNIALGGSVFAYSGDTQWTPVLTEAADGAALFAVEAYTFDRPVRYHLDYQTLRNHVHDLHAKRIVLTHMSTSMLDRLPETDLPAAHDGMTIDI